MTSTHRRRGALPLVLLSGALLAAGCTTNLDTFPDTARVVVRGDYLERRPLPGLTDYQASAQARVRDLLQEPLTLPAAMEIAMLNTPRLQEHYQAAQIWDEDLVAEITAAAQKETDPTATALDWVGARLALMKSVNTTDRFDFPAEYVEVAEDFVETGEKVRKAYFDAVAAQQIEDMLQQAATATQAAAEIANAQYQAGTTNRRAQALQLLTHAEVVKELAAAQRSAIAAREALNRLLVLWGDDAAWAAPERLPDLPAARPQYADLESFALTRRFDALSERKSWAMWHTAADVRSEVRENYAALLIAYDLAKYQKEVVLPLAAAVLGETQKEYNGMLMGIYELLDDRRAQIDAGRDYVETLRDFWIAQAELAQAVGGQLPQ